MQLPCTLKLLTSQRNLFVKLNTEMKSLQKMQIFGTEALFRLKDILSKYSQPKTTHLGKIYH